MTDAAPQSVEERVRATGAALGFDLLGFARAVPTERTRFLAEWIDRGFAGEMHYLPRRLEERIDPRKVLPEARSLIVVGVYFEGDDAHSAPDESRGQIARYAGGEDYHDVILDRVRALENALPVIADQPLRSRSYVDTGPVSERAAAEAAGLGWIGKNSCLIHPDWGSHLMLGVILTELALETDEPIRDHCGSCRACLDVCPTDAFAEPYVLDATRCISYTTIESSEAIPDDLRSGQGQHVFGCDLCQEVCPWNKSRPRTAPSDPLGLRLRLAKHPEWIRPTLAWLLALDEADFLETTRKTAIRRTGFRGLMRNALVAAGNSQDPTLRASLDRFLDGEDELLREHAAWALERLDRCGPA